MGLETRKRIGQLFKQGKFKGDPNAELWSKGFVVKELDNNGFFIKYVKEATVTKKETVTKRETNK